MLTLLAPYFKVFAPCQQRFERKVCSHPWVRAAGRKRGQLSYSGDMVSPRGLLLVLCRCRARCFSHPCVQVSRNLSTRCNKHVIPSQRRSARSRKVKLWSWCQAGRFQLSTCCVSHLAGHARACRVTKVCSRNCAAALASSLCSFLWFYC